MEFTNGLEEMSTNHCGNALDLVFPQQVACGPPTEVGTLSHRGVASCLVETAVHQLYFFWRDAGVRVSYLLGLL
jgi:hypothetical protein